MPINNRGLSGQPILPYVDYRSYQNSDVFIDLTFLDHTGTPVVPTSFKYQIDDLTNATPVKAQTSVPIGIGGITGSTYTLQIPGSILQMTHNWQGSEIFQIWMTSTWIDPVTSTTCTTQGVAILELLAIQTPNGAL